MANQSVIQTSFSGISPDSKSGLPNSARMVRFVDIYDDSDSLTLNPKTVKDSSSVVVDLIKWIVEGHPYTTKLYGYGDAGHIYSEDAGTWADLRTVSGGAGQGLAVLERALYYATSTTLGRYQYIDSTPTFNDDFLSDGIENLDPGSAASLDTSGNTYTLATSIAETATHRQTFTPTRDPIKTIQVLVASKGTGNWTLTLHDADNVSLGTVTITNGSLTNSVDNNFTFTTPIRVRTGQSYHFHLTSTVADGTVTTTTASDLETVDFHIFFGILIANTKYHPMIIHTDGTRGQIVIGNNNYFASYNGITYHPNKIQIEPGYEIRGFYKENEFVVAFCWKGSDVAGAEEGRLFYWDGISPYYNYSKPITGGLPNAMINFKNNAFSILGHTGEMNLGTEPFMKIQDIPQLPKGKKVEVMPGAICIWQDRVHFGVGSSDDATVEQGVYEYGNTSDRATSSNSIATECLNYAYKISTGTSQSTTLSIGALHPRGTKLYIAWKDNTTYGVDKVTLGGDPSASGGWESLILDVGGEGKNLKSMPQKEKSAYKIIITYDTLPTGCTITPKYKINREASWNLGSAATATSTEAELLINKRYKEIQIGFDIVATVNYPTITSVVFIFDPNTSETNE